MRVIIFILISIAHLVSGPVGVYLSDKSIEKHIEETMRETK